MGLYAAIPHRDRGTTRVGAGCSPARRVEPARATALYWTARYHANQGTMSDTSPAAQAIQDEIHRRMSGEERLKLAMEMSDMARAFAVARLRQEHPDWTEWEIKRQLLRYAFGSEPWPAILR